MTLFLIAFIVFIVYNAYETGKRNQIFEKRKKEVTSNAAEQYKIACGIIEEMADSYRYFASTRTIEEYFYLKDHNHKTGLKWYERYWAPSYNKKTYEVEIPEKIDNYLEFVESDKIINLISNKEHYRGYDLERIWILSTALACGYDIEDKNLLKLVYRQKLCDKLPNNPENVTLKEWKTLYPNFKKSKKYLDKMLTISIYTKEEILYDYMKDDVTHWYDCYAEYRVEPILQEIADEYGLPTQQTKLHKTTYFCLKKIAVMYSKRAIHKMGYCPVDCFWRVVPNPTQKDIERASHIKTQSEVWLKEIEQSSKEADKYPYL